MLLNKLPGGIRYGKSPEKRDVRTLALRCDRFTKPMRHTAKGRAFHLTGRTRPGRLKYRAASQQVTVSFDRSRCSAPPICFLVRNGRTLQTAAHQHWHISPSTGAEGLGTSASGAKKPPAHISVLAYAYTQVSSGRSY